MHLGWAGGAMQLQLFLPDGAKSTLLNSHGQHDIWWFHAQGFDIAYKEIVVPKSIRDENQGKSIADDIMSSADTIQPNPERLQSNSNANNAKQFGTPAQRTPEQMKAVHQQARKEVHEHSTAIASQLLPYYADNSEFSGETLAITWNNTYLFNADHTWEVFPEDGTTYVTTGDISQMWLRDSSVQMMTYLPLMSKQKPESALRQVLESVLVRQNRFIKQDPYASAFFLETSPKQRSGNVGPSRHECPKDADICHDCHCHDCAPKCGPYTYQHDFELDSYCFSMDLHYKYWKMTGATNHFTEEFFHTWEYEVLPMLRNEQYHETRSPYYYKPVRNKVNDGTGLVWSFARPSDDQTVYGYNIPQNIFLAVILKEFHEICQLYSSFGKGNLGEQALSMAREIDTAIHQYGISQRDGNKIYAFEVDGLGNQILADDANMPNLLGLPYLGYTPEFRQSLWAGSTAGPTDLTEDLYPATREFVLNQGLSKAGGTRDPDFFNGKYEGLGSPHASTGLRSKHPGPWCNSHCIWHLGLIMQGWTDDSPEVKSKMMQEILSTTDNQQLMHEGFDPNNPSAYNRDWFGWANGMFSLWVLQDWVPDNHQPATTTTATTTLAATTTTSQSKKHRASNPGLPDLTKILGTVQTAEMKVDEELLNKHYAFLQLDPGSSTTMSQLIQTATDDVLAESDRVANLLANRHSDRAAFDVQKLVDMWNNVFSFNANLWWIFKPDDSVFMITGDIPQMWLRDSSVQMSAYLPLVSRQGQTSALSKVFLSLLYRQMEFIKTDPYSTGFYQTTSPTGYHDGPNLDRCAKTPDCPKCRCRDCSPACGPFTLMHEYEIDSLLYPMLLSHQFWKWTNQDGHLSLVLDTFIDYVMPLLKKEQYHESRSNYRMNNGWFRSIPKVKEGIGLVWTFARPSDDQVTYGYNIASNIMLVVVLQQVANIAEHLGKSQYASELLTMAREVDAGVHEYGVFEHNGKEIYAFEVDGFGKKILEDDANMPNLLWLPYLNYTTAFRQRLWAGAPGAEKQNLEHDYYLATREFVLSKSNPHYFESAGTQLSGLGSKHASTDKATGHGGKACTSGCVSEKKLHACFGDFYYNKKIQISSNFAFKSCFCNNFR